MRRLREASDRWMLGAIDSNSDLLTSTAMKQRAKDDLIIQADKERCYRRIVQ